MIAPGSGSGTGASSTTSGWLKAWSTTPRAVVIVGAPFRPHRPIAEPRACDARWVWGVVASSRLTGRASDRAPSQLSAWSLLAGLRTGPLSEVEDAVEAAAQADERLDLADRQQRAIDVGLGAAPGVVA